MVPVFVVNRIREARMKMCLTERRAGSFAEARQQARRGYNAYLGINPNSRMILMNTSQKLLLAFVSILLLGASAWATPITVPVEQANRVRGPLFLPIDTGIASLDGQTLSLNFVFPNDLFVRLFSSTTKSFHLSAMLTLQGEGQFARPFGSGYTFGANGLPDSSIFTYSPGIAGSTHGIETFSYSLGFVFPLIDPAGPATGVAHPFDVYGMHLDITLPNNGAFQVLGAQFALFPPSSKSWEQVYAIGPHVPESGGTLPLFAIGLLAMLGFQRKHG